MSIKVKRRKFMGMAGSLAASSIAVPTIIPASALGRNGTVAPSNRIIMGAIGIRGRGTSDLNWMMQEPDVQFVAICDIRKDRRLAVKEMIDKKYNSTSCEMYRDLREFLPARPDIDGILIATGDRWHALGSCMAMQAGKDVYSEKPTGMCIADGRALLETAKRTGKVFQNGTQRRSVGPFAVASELVRLGRLGKIHTVRAHLAPWDSPYTTHKWLPEEPLPSKDEVDWDMWLGPCPWRPYNQTYINGGWRGHYDFHTGSIGEWGSHTINQCQIALGMDHTCPVEYKFPNNLNGEGLVATYENGIKMILNTSEVGGWRGSCGVKFEGTEGWASVADGYAVPDVSSPSLLSDYNKVLNNYIEREQRPMNHVRDFFNCMKNRRLAIANAGVTHRAMSVVHAANICMWLKRDLKYDPVKEEFLNDAEANRMRVRAQREPWCI